MGGEHALKHASSESNAAEEDGERAERRWEAEWCA